MSAHKSWVKRCAICVPGFYLLNVLFQPFNIILLVKPDSDIGGKLWANSDGNQSIYCYQ